MKTIHFIFVAAFIACLYMPLLGQNPAQNRAKLQALYGLINNRQLSELADYISPDAVDHAIPADFAAQSGLKGPELLAAFMEELIMGFPDLKITPIRFVAEGDYVMCYLAMSGTHEGTFMGIPPTGNTFMVYDVDIVRYDGKGTGVEHWAVQDGSQMMAQLGIAPENGNRARDVVQQIYADFGQGNIAGIEARLDEAVAWTDAGSGVADLYIGTRKGKAAVLDFFEKLGHHLDITRFDLYDMLVDGNKVAVTGHITGKGRATGVDFASDWAMTWEINDVGKVTRHHLYLDTDQLGRAIDPAAYPAAGAAYAFLRAMDQGDMQALYAVTSPDFVIYHPNHPQPLDRQTFWQQQVVPTNAAISGIHHEVKEVCVSGNKVSMVGVVTGTHTGDLMGIPASGNDIQTDWIAYVTLNDEGRIEELHVQFNQLAFLSQLGANPLAKK
ncbi:MAG: hypothetical protein D6730_06580 [Bacteroidetes bacterium]|nr:MAG: hypothetical protein D6730_06580 [Bacteroidota bacterium]